ncbi:MAG: lipid A phosphoethanolamine transferase [Alistipes sp.]|nr:lipid A phosphoethanolamine transferase [Alistipes sp.]
MFLSARRITPKHLSYLFVAALMLPVVILALTEHTPFWVSVACVVMQLGGYTLFASLARRSGVMVWIGLPLIFFSAFQVVLLYLFGNSVIAADMFLNILTTNPTEASELLGNIYPALVAVVVIYIPLLWGAFVHIRKRRLLRHRLRVRMAAAGATTFLAGCMVLVLSGRYDVGRIVRDELFPVNATYNLGVAISEARKIKHFNESSANFRFRASRTARPECREVYVFVIGEASRAASWQLFGYERATNPLLSRRDDLYLFDNITTQSNATHKSVPLLLSSAHTSQHNELYRRKGIPALFNEADFTTYFISNQQPQGAMIDLLARDAHHIIYMDSPHLDMQLVGAMRHAIEEDDSQKILFILHTYGSHYSYRHRYPREFARFVPDDKVPVRRRNAEMIRNAYDNSILYTDFVLNEIISSLDSLEGISTAMLYCADHGEDLFDEGKRRFLHSSPKVTYHQLHIASLAWFSPTYRELFPEKVEAAALNKSVPATTYAGFHTLADMASITSPYVEPRASLVNIYYDFGAVRYYLNDHNRAVKLNAEIGIDQEERATFAHYGIKL